MQAERKQGKQHKRKQGQQPETEDRTSMCPDLADVEMTTEKVTRTFREWTQQFALHLYPQVGTCNYRVPAFYFNHQNLLTPEQAAKRKLLSLPAAPPPHPPTPSSFSPSLSSSSSSVSSSASTSPSPSLIHCEDVDMCHEGVALASCESGSGTGGRPAWRDTEVLTGGASTLPSYGLKESEPELLHVSAESPGICRREYAAVNGVSSAATALSHTSQASTPAGDSGPHPGRAGADPQTAQVEGLRCGMSSLHDAAETVVDVATKRGEHALSSGRTDQLLFKVPAVKGRAKRRRKGISKHAETSPETPVDAELREGSRDEHQRRQHLQVSVFKGLAISDSDHEEEPSEKKERPACSFPPTDQEVQENSPTALCANHEGPSPHCKKKSKKLKRSSRSPKTRVQPVQVMFPSQESMVRRDKAMALVLDSFQALGQALEGNGEDGLFIISGINYDHYLSRVPNALLRERGGGYLGDSPTCRGILDMLILQRHAGMVLVQVKSVGGNLGDWQADEEATLQVLKAVIDKVTAKSSSLRRQLCRELIGAGDGRSGAGEGEGGRGGGGGGGGREDGLPSESGAAVVQHVLALPFIPRAVYNKILQGRGQSVHSGSDSVNSTQMYVLCQEDFQDPPSCATNRAWNTLLPSPDTRPSRRSVRPGSSAVSSLQSWWRRTFGHCRSRLSVEKVQEVVGRICGPFSTVAVQPDTKCRSEVRTYGHCISETATRYSAPRLTQQQFDLLSCQDPCVALCGPPGSGKSMVLTLKAVQWLEQGDESQNHVVVASFGRKMATPPRDQWLQSAIHGRKSESTITGELLHTMFVVDEMVRDDVELEVAHVVDSLLSCVRQSRSPAGSVDLAGRQKSEAVKSSLLDKFHFVVNDVDPNEEKTQLVLRALCRHDLVRSVWWSTTEPPRSPELMSLLRVETFAHVIRRPHHVQQVMKALEWRGKWKELYAADSDEYALPTEGPPVIWIQHQHHRHERLKDRHALQTCISDPCDVARKSFDENSVQHLPQTIIHCDETCEVSANLTYQADQGHVMDQDQKRLQYQPHCSNAREPFHINERHQDTACTRKLCEPGLSEQVVCKDDVTKPVCPLNTMSEGCFSKLCRSVCQKEDTHSTAMFHSPFWCEKCAETTADIISQLIIDSINPSLSHFVVGSTKLLKEFPKNRFGDAIKPQDILILSDFTCHLSGTRETNKDKDSSIEELAQSSLVLRMREVIPLKILTEESSDPVALTSRSAVLTDISCARGLERKVVIYVPWKRPEARSWIKSSQNGCKPKSDHGIDQDLKLLTAETIMVPTLYDNTDCKTTCKSRHVVCNTTKMSVYEQGNRCYHTANGHQENQDDESTRKDISLSCSISESTCPVIKKTGKFWSEEQGFIRCEQDTNRNTLVPIQQSDDPASRSLSNESSLSRGDVLPWTSNSSEVMYETQDDPLDNVRDAEKDKEYCFTEVHGTSALYESYTARSRTQADFNQLGVHNGRHNVHDQHLPFQKSTPYHKEQKEKESNNADIHCCKESTFLTSAPNDHQPQQQETEVLVPSTGRGKEQLPSWMEFKDRSISQRSLRRKHLQNKQSEGRSGDLHSASTSVLFEEGDVLLEGGVSQDLEGLLAGLGDVLSRGVFAAAACCLAQLVVILP